MTLFSLIPGKEGATRLGGVSLEVILLQRTPSLVMPRSTLLARALRVLQEEQAELSHLGIRENCVINGAIIDKNVCVGAGSRITNERRVKESNREREGFIIQDGIVTVLKNAVLPPGTVI
jgi:ADP-glucose pyrophosphorylase